MAPLFIGIAWTFKAAGVTIGFLIACSKPVKIGFHVAEAVQNILCKMQTMVTGGKKPLRQSRKRSQPEP